MADAILRSAIDQIAERFATACRTGSRRRLRENADDLVLELLAALKTASLAEIAQTAESLERKRRARASAVEAASLRMQRERSEVSKQAPEPVRPPPSRDPFDITMPGELLDPAAEAPASVRRFREAAPVGSEEPRMGSGPMRQPGEEVAARAEMPAILKSAEPSGSTATKEDRAEAVRLPGVSLRDGEQLLRTGGAGVVIRRARSA
ncbi:MAG TPA: hypothetical protein VGY54_22330 [Polyangiaceae bacterium]|nr:hypothetical protein [Polyangiaceae bacterium]